MDFILTNLLSGPQTEQVLSLYRLTEVVSVEQCPGFSAAADPDMPVLYLLAYRQNELCGYACVKIKKRIMAWVIFGPVVRHASDYTAVCNGLISKLAYRGILMIRIVPPWMKEEDKTALESERVFDFESSDEEINWCSLRLALDRPLDEIFKGFSENHRRSIKKAQKLGLTAARITQPADIDIFTDQYVQMYQGRGLPVSPELTRTAFQNLFSYFAEQDNGSFLAVRTSSGDIVGGLCISWQGNAAFYYKGYSHPDHRNLPVNHLAFYQAMAMAMERGLKYFDFGGYANNVKEGDQLFAINRFKDGFGGELVVHPRTMLVYTWPLTGMLYKIFRRMRRVPG